MKKLLTAVVFLLISTALVAQSNTGTIDQFGTNIAKIEQTGSGNNGDIDQGELGSSVTNSGPQTSWLYGAFIEQTGISNNAIIDVNTSNAGASIFQDGDNNWAKQDLNSTYHKTTDWDRMGLDIDQVGNNNWANQKTIYSFGSYGVQGMVINQEGNSNIADQMSIGGRSNLTEVIQIGNNNNNETQSGNVFDVSSTGLTNPLLLPWAHKPAGDYTQYANQMFGTTHMYVEGDNNNTFQYQEYSVWGLSGRNHANLDLYGNGNDVVQGQLGEYNDSDIDIDGDGNVVTTSQFGDNNTADIDIVNLGMNNTAAIEQIGNSNTGTIYQNGTSNMATIIQQP